MEEAPEAKEEIPIGIKLMILLICGFIVAFAWAFSQPPAWSVFWPRADVTIVKVESQKINASTIRFDLVARDPDGKARVFYYSRNSGVQKRQTKDGQSTLVATAKKDLKPGDRISVILGPGTVMANTWPLVQLLLALGSMVLFGLIAAVLFNAKLRALMKMG